MTKEPNALLHHVPQDEIQSLPTKARALARRLYESSFDGMRPSEPHDLLLDLAAAVEFLDREVESLREDRR